jgi:hypothetical protein
LANRTNPLTYGDLPVRTAWLGLAWLGLAWLGLAWLGSTVLTAPTQHHCAVLGCDHWICDGVMCAMSLLLARDHCWCTNPCHARPLGNTHCHCYCWAAGGPLLEFLQFFGKEFKPCRQGISVRKGECYALPLPRAVASSVCAPSNHCGMCHSSVPPLAASMRTAGYGRVSLPWFPQPPAAVL